MSNKTADQIAEQVLCNFSKFISPDWARTFLLTKEGKKISNFVKTCLKDLKPNQQQIESGKFAKAISDAILSGMPEVAEAIKEADAIYRRQLYTRHKFENEFLGGVSPDLIQKLKKLNER